MCHLKLKNHIEKYRTKLTTKIDIKKFNFTTKDKAKKYVLKNLIYLLFLNSLLIFNFLLLTLKLNLTDN